MPVPSRQKHRVVYTCLFGFSEQFNDFAYESPHNTDFICFTDDPSLTSSFWQIRLMPQRLLDPARCAKTIKQLPHRYLPDYSESLYLDNTVKLKIDPERIFRTLDDQISPLTCFKHPWRSCIYDEAVEIIRAQIDREEVVRQQMAYYRSLGYPEQNGLTANGILLRRHHNECLISASEDWNAQTLRFSMRDQLSFPVAAWHHDLKVAHFEGSLVDNALVQWPVVKGPRLPRDFDDAAYLELHPDVRGQNPRQHYLLHGLKEGRQYRR